MIIFCPKTLSMIVPKEIIENDIVKVLVNEDGLEDEMYGIVGMNTGRTLGLRYLNPTEFVYKSACVYEIDQESELSPAPYESIMEHYPLGTTFEDLDMKSLGMNRYVMYSEIDVEDSDSEIHSDGSDIGSFIVSDSEVVSTTPPPGYQAIDKEWNEWEPTTSGGRSFKETINMIEKHLSNSA